MSLLKSLENRIASLVEGGFGRVFASEVRPVEIARKLAREMEEHKSYSLSRTYAPNEFHVFLSPQDRERFAAHEDALLAEFVGYLLEHARRERLALVSRPVVHLQTDRRLRLGEFGIQTSLVEPEPEPEPELEPEPARSAAAVPAAPAAAAPAPPAPRRPAAPPRPAVDSGRTMVHSTASRVAEQLADARPPRRESPLLVMDGRRLIVGADGVTLGRSRQSDVMVDDANVSRAHAEIRPHGRAWVLTDLGSTNGTRLNGRRVTRPETLAPGDEIELGTATLRFILE
jgi:hypothetical protein